MLSMLASTPWLQFNPLSLMNDNKGASASNLGHVDVIRLQGDTGSDESGLSATLCDFGASGNEGVNLWIGYGAIYVQGGQQDPRTR